MSSKTTDTAPSSRTTAMSAARRAGLERARYTVSWFLTGRRPGRVRAHAPVATGRRLTA